MFFLVFVCVLAAVAVLGLVTLDRMDARARQFKTLQRQNALQAARLGEYEDLIHTLREAAWDSRDIDPVLSQLVIARIREAKTDPDRNRKRL